MALDGSLQGSLGGLTLVLDVSGGGSGIDNITGLVSAGTNVTITGSGTFASPYVINAIASGGSGGTGTVTNVSVVTANGFSGTVSSASTTPAITLQTTVNGILKGNGTAITSAQSGTDYQAPGNYITSVSGDITINGPGAVIGTLSNTAVSAGSYTLASITVDSKGRIIDASNGTAGTGTVTSVAVSGKNGIGVAGSPITNSGTIDLSLGNITPTSVSTGIVSASTVNATGDIQAASGRITVSAATITGKLTGTTAVFSGIVSADAGINTTTVSAASIGVTGDINASTGRVIASAATITSKLTGNTAAFSGVVSADAGIRATIVSADSVNVTGDIRALTGRVLASAATISGVVSAATLNSSGDVQAPAGRITASAATFTSTVSASNLGGTNTGDVTLGGENYLTISGQVVSARPVNLASTNISGTLGVTNGGTGKNSVAVNKFLYASSSNTYSEDDYQDQAEGAYTGTIVWAGTTAPSGTTNHRYRWTRIGKFVNLAIVLNYGTAGTGVSQATMDLPAGAPTPNEWTGLGAANEHLYSGSGMLMTTTTAAPNVQSRGYMDVNASDTGYVAQATGASANYRVAIVNIQYWSA